MLPFDIWGLNHALFEVTAHVDNHPIRSRACKLLIGLLWLTWRDRCVGKNDFPMLALMCHLFSNEDHLDLMRWGQHVHGTPLTAAIPISQWHKCFLVFMVLIYEGLGGLEGDMTKYIFALMWLQQKSLKSTCYIQSSACTGHTYVGSRRLIVPLKILFLLQIKYLHGAETHWSWCDPWSY